MMIDDDSVSAAPAPVKRKAEEALGEDNDGGTPAKKARAEQGQGEGEDDAIVLWGGLEI